MNITGLCATAAHYGTMLDNNTDPDVFNFYAITAHLRSVGIDKIDIYISCKIFIRWVFLTKFCNIGTHQRSHLLQATSILKCVP